MTCPLCLNKTIDFYQQDKLRDYWQCQNCHLVFVKPEQQLNQHDEKLIYDQHQNNPDDVDYRKFLNKLIKPLIKRLPISAQGLDFGSGPGPTISVMMQEQGFKVENYDYYYANKPKLLKAKYGFITCTEVMEHLSTPHRVLSTLTDILVPQGILGIMTKRVTSKQNFKNWHYKNDPTHVCFYSEATFVYIAKQWQYDLEIIGFDTVILTKSRNIVSKVGKPDNYL
ncbi:MAG: class I SAM-dependent methyltransferase [Proteobacteria bacterium]|nr:class I SAM-dependent methyltransferase [Pseudomonadota bacterium]